MGRLTERKYGEIVSSKREKTQIHCSNFCNNCSQGAGNCGYVREMVEKLAEYEDAEEQGLLLRLPCEYKTKVYVVPTNENGLKDIAEMLCLGYSIGEPQNNMNLFSTNRFNKDVPKMYQPSIDEFGKTVFLTKEEAEQKLESMKRE